MEALLPGGYPGVQQEIPVDRAKGAPARYTWDADPPCLPDKDGQYPMAVPGVTNFL